MKLKTKERSSDKKSTIKAARRAGSIPAVIYAKGKEAKSLFVSNKEWQKVIDSLKPGRLSTVVFSLLDEKGTETKAIVKEVQYHPTTYNVLHLDFEELQDDVQINIKVPIEFTGAAECIGVKLGGALRQVVRKVKVRCFPKDIPVSFKIDVSSLNQRESKKINAITFPEGVTPTENTNNVAVVIAKR